METVTLTIDGRPVTVEKGKTVLQAAIESGISVPYYCYHPGISIDGSCRVCIVKIEKMPKLQTSCSTLCADGMTVFTRTPEVIQARAGVFEFLLINHPLDCPVCDKGGECPLQDFSYTFGPDQSRMEFPRRVFDGDGVKADVDFGPTLMLNRNRCILCTRCVRFMRDVDGDAQINIIDRGYGSEIATFQEQGVHSLLSGNLADVCPVGAITTRNYRFKSRPWDNPSAVDTICTFCAKGCNTTAWIKAKPEWARGRQLIRITPRFNPDVNGYWMCDIGRFDIPWVEGDDRVTRPLARGASGVQERVPWHEVTTKVGERLAAARAGTSGGVQFLVSAHASHEELHVLRRLAGALGSASAGEGQAPAPAGAPITISWRCRAKQQPEDTRFKVPSVDAPNVAGARSLGLAGGGEQPDVSALRAAVEAGRVSALYVFDPGPEGSIGQTDWIVEARSRGTLPLLVVQGVLLTPLARAADFVLPGASFAEKDASYTNEKGQLQAAARALAPLGDAMEDWEVLVNLGVALGVPFNYANAAHIRSEIGAEHPDDPGLAGITTLAFSRPVTARTWLEASNPSERWKWDFMFQDLPPVKGTVDPSSVPHFPDGAIPLRKIE